VGLLDSLMMNFDSVVFGCIKDLSMS